MVSGATLALVLLVPWPRSTLVQGVVWPPTRPSCASMKAGFVAPVLVPDGQPVRTGDMVLQLASPQLAVGSQHASGRGWRALRGRIARRLAR